jgi:hypothetical protein
MADYVAGTPEDPIVVNSAGNEQYCGCTGFPADSHNVLWITVRPLLVYRGVADILSSPVRSPKPDAWSAVPPTRCTTSARRKTRTRTTTVTATTTTARRHPSQKIWLTSSSPSTSTHRANPIEPAVYLYCHADVFGHLHCNHVA